jgi:hypothetical protein
MKGMVNVKLTLCLTKHHVMEVSSQLHALAALPPGESAPDNYWIGRWVGSQNRSGRRGKEETSQPLLGIELQSSNA